MTFRTRPNYRHYDEQIRRQAPLPLTDHDIEVIKHRQEQVQRRVLRAMLDPYFLLLSDTSGDDVTSQGAIAYRRQLSFAKVSLFNEGRNLLNHWAAIKDELIIPWGLHYYNASASQWRAVGTRLDSSTFFTTKREGFDADELALYRGRWLPVEASAIPGYGLVETDDALEFVGVVGGVDPLLAHPEQTFAIRNPGGHIVIAGAAKATEIQIDAGVHAEFPVAYGVTDSLTIPWMTLSPSGLLTLAPPAGTSGEFVRDVTAVDGLGVEVLFQLTVTVLI